MNSEADTCRKYVVPKLLAAGWDSDPHSIAEQRTITDGRVIPVGKEGFVRKPPKRVDYLLRYTRDFPLAVVEAKASYKTATDAVQQARTYAEMLGLRFAYATNGADIIEIDYFRGTETPVSVFPEPDELWHRYQTGSGLTGSQQADQLIAPYNIASGKPPRYYQQIAINRTVESILAGKQRLLLTMAAGTGKTIVAFQICWKLWSSRWNQAGEYRKPRILYLADRNILIDDPKDKTFTPFGDARYKIDSGEVVKSREMYFAIYQALAEDERRAGLFRDYPPDFFDLIIVDECHRGSARDNSSWRVILEHFKPAFQLGMTATPLREDNCDTYLYFGNPIYQYSLRQGIDDGFLAPYRVHRVVTQWDAAGWRPSKDEVDRYGREIPDDEYQTKDFERVIALRARTLAIARHLPPKACVPSPALPPSCAEGGLMQRSAARSLPPSRNAALTSSNWRNRPARPMPIPSTCCAILPSMRRFTHAASARRGSSPTARIISTNSCPKRVRFSMSFWKSMRNTVTRNSFYRTY